MKRYKCKVLFKLQLSCNNLTYNALQYPLFCIAKEPVLLGKSAYIAAQNNRFCNAKQFGSLSACTFFTKWKSFLGFTVGLLLPCFLPTFSLSDGLLAT